MTPDYFSHNARTTRDVYALSRTAQPREPYRARREDTVDFPDMLVTEEEATADTMRRYLSAEERRAMELIP